MIDSHAHITKEFYSDIEDVIKNEKNKMLAIINASDSIETANEIIEYSNKNNGFLYSVVGIHPENINNLSDIDTIEKIIKKHKVVGVGEIGLDYSYRDDNKELQKEFFIKQINLANKYNLPVVVHSRDAIWDTYDILKKNKCRGVIHCFSGSVEMAELFVKLGYYLGIGGVLTFKNSTLYKVIEKIDLNSILIETDSPFLTPHPFRGEKNYPSKVKFVAQKIAEIKNISVEEVCKITSKNAIDLFDLDIQL